MFGRLIRETRWLTAKLQNFKDINDLYGWGRGVRSLVPEVHKDKTLPRIQNTSQNILGCVVFILGCVWILGSVCPY